MVELHRACPNSECTGRVPVDQPNCPECGANYVATKIERSDPETRKNPSGRAGGKTVSSAAAARQLLWGGAGLVAVSVGLLSVRGAEANSNLVFTLLISGIVAIVGGLNMRAFAKRQAEREAKRRE